MIKKRVIGIGLATLMGITTVSTTLVPSAINVYAAESKILKEARANISHITYSLKKNYLGLKNQGDWENYIKKARTLIAKIPSSESKAKQELTDEVNRGEALVKALARINQVEKSMQPKSEGGYGNALIPKNVPTWREYIRLANEDLEKVNLNVFKSQYDELINRRDIVNKKLDEIMNGGTIKDYQANGYNIKRMYGTDSFTNAGVVAQEFKRMCETGDLVTRAKDWTYKVDTAILVDVNDKWAGALAGSIVYSEHSPILFLDGDSIPKTTESALKNINAKNVIFISSENKDFEKSKSTATSLGLKVKDTIKAPNRYDLSFKISELAGYGSKKVDIRLVDGDSKTAFERTITQQTLAQDLKFVILLPTKGKTIEETFQYNNFLTTAKEQWNKNSVSHMVFDKNFLEYAKKFPKTGPDAAVRGYTAIEDRPYVPNIYLNSEDRDLMLSYGVFMANGEKEQDLISMMALATINETPIVYGGDKTSKTFPEPDQRKGIYLRFNDDTYGRKVNKVFILGNETDMKNGVEKKLKGEDY